MSSRGGLEESATAHVGAVAGAGTIGAAHQRRCWPRSALPKLQPKACGLKLWDAQVMLGAAGPRASGGATAYTAADLPVRPATFQVRSPGPPLTEDDFADAELRAHASLSPVDVDPIGLLDVDRRCSPADAAIAAIACCMANARWITGKLARSTRVSRSCRDLPGSAGQPLYPSRGGSRCDRPQARWSASPTLPPLARPAFPETHPRVGARHPEGKGQRRGRPHSAFQGGAGGPARPLLASSMDSMRSARW